MTRTFVASVFALVLAVGAHRALHAAPAGVVRRRRWCSRNTA